MKSNLGIKVTILSVSIIIAVVLVNLFYKKLVAPPTNIDYENLHKESIATDIHKLDGTKTWGYLDSLYILINDKIDLFASESFININEKDQAIKDFGLSYVPAFKKYKDEFVKKEGWGNTHFSVWKKRISEMMRLALSSGIKVVQGSNIDDLNKVMRTMSNYEDARKIANTASFTTVTNAIRDINSAKNKLEDPEICKSNLVSKLEVVAGNIEKAHYRHLVHEVNELSDYMSMTKDSFQSMVTEVYNRINEYNNEKNIYGNYARNIDKLKADAGSYVSAANSYYASLNAPHITVNTNGSWIEIASPNSLYRAYQSYSNWHIINGKATMSFKIRGYSGNFTFYIDSYSETGCDYVMVGLDSVPSEQSNRANTKDWSKSPTTFSNFKTVTFSGLDGSREYTVYVVYKKDSSIDRNDDRGYILLPKNAL